MAGELQKTMEKGGPPAPVSPNKGGKAAEAGVLEQARRQIETLKNGISNGRERMDEVGGMIVNTVEITATNLAASAAEGYWGEEKLKLGPVDIRAISGGGLALYGVYKAMNGKGGSHELAIANGLLQSLTSSVGRRAGEALREKSGGGTGGTGGAGGTGAGGLQEGAIIEQGGKKYRVTGGALVEISGASTADVEGIVRDIGRNLQISAEPDEDGEDDAGARGGRGRKRRRGKGRKRPQDFVPVRVR